MGNVINDYIYIFHNSTLYIFLYILIQILLFILNTIGNNKYVQNFFFKLTKKIKKFYNYYMKSAHYNDISKKIEISQKKIEKYNKIIDENKKKNKHLNEYDLMILNGKYTRKVLKEEKILNELIKIINNENKNNYFTKISDTILLFLYSKNILIRHIKTQIYVVIIFLILNYFVNNELRESCLKIHSHLKFKNNFKIIPS
ncbi:conserved Plasmodium protein, unknown function, partial [Plasmodium gallinaceum]